MNNERWEQVQTIFHQAVELPVAQRSSLVGQLCHGDEELAAEVLALLEVDAQPNSLLDEGLSQTPAELLCNDELASLVEQQIGPYRLRSLLGEGGMGVVYLAERNDIGGQVAIKLLRDAWLSPMRRERFVSEQRILAKLNHPAIAKIFDSGTLDNGTPWFVMEYVDGQTLTDYWRARRNNVRQCLLLFRHVCEAVQFAHEHAIIHRDLKPSNVFVNERGDVKLLDFGIAKQIDLVEEDGQRTITSLRLMTPSYAAPEQQAGGALGVFTDVYALGVLLYELLTGQLPWKKTSTTQEDPNEGKDRSIVVPSEIARREFGSFARSLTRAEWSDLDLLCRTAMQPEVSLRYRSVDILIRDLDAFLDGRPLTARPPSFRYRTRRFLRRQRKAVIASAVVFAVLAGTLLFAGLRIERARRAELVEAARAQRIERFTENLFQGGDQTAGPMEDLRVTDLLARGRTEADGLSSDPAMQAQMRETLGTIYRKLGKFQEANALLEASLAGRQQKDGSQQANYAESLRALGLLKRDENKLDDAEKLTGQALEIDRRIYPASSPEVLRSMVALGSIIERRGDYDRAAKILEASMKLRAQANAASEEAAENLVELADVYFYQGHYEPSQSLNLRALTIERNLFGSEHPAVADVMNNLGAINANIGHYAEAENYYRQAVAISEHWYGKDHPETAANLTALAQTLVRQKRYDEARASLERALAIQERVYGPDHSQVALTLNELGLLAFNQSDNQAAEKDFLGALAIWRKSYGDHHQFVGVAYSNLGGVYADEKDYPRAEQMFRQAILVLREAVTDDHVNTAIAHLKLGRVLVHENRLNEAEAEVQIAYQYLSKHVAPQNQFLIGARKALFEIYGQLREPEKAAEFRADTTPVSLAGK